MPPSRYAKVQEAIERHKQFTGHDAKNIDNYADSELDIGVGFKIGQCDGIMYTTVRDGKTEHYCHEFKKKSRPLLVSSHDGSVVGIVGGRYRFTERGIVDE